MNPIQFWQLTFTKVRFNLKSEASKSYLSYLWWVLEPSLFVTVFYVVFGILLKNNTENFLAFLFCGLIPFLWFSKSVSNSSQSVITGRGLINQIAINKMFFPTVIIFQDFSKQSAVFAILFIFLIAYGIPASSNWLWVIPIIITQLLLVAAIAYLVSSITPFLPDFTFLVETGLQLLLFCSGIFFSYEDVLLPEHRSMFLMNPIANLIKNYRQVLIDGESPDLTALFLISLFSIIVIFIMYMVFKKLNTTYSKVVLQ